MSVEPKMGILGPIWLLTSNFWKNLLFKKIPNLGHIGHINTKIGPVGQLFKYVDNYKIKKCLKTSPGTK